MKLLSCTFHGGKVVYVPTFQFFFSLPLILTLLAASICHFLIPALNFSCFFLRSELLLSIFLFLFLFFCCCCCCCCCFVFRFSSFSVIGVSVVVVAENGPTHGHVVTKFSRIYSLPFFSFVRPRASLILIPYYEKWLLLLIAPYFQIIVPFLPKCT